HGKGLKLGIYGDRGPVTCGSYPGSEDHEAQDAATFAGWGIDYLKYDNCPAPSPDSATLQARYGKMAEALAATGRPIVYSLCAWSCYEWGIGMGQLWRTTSDITPTWASIMANLQSNRAVAGYAGPNGWNDPDMLEVGNFAPAEAETELMLTEYRSHFALWAIMAAPLILGNDLRGARMSDAVRDIVTNPEVIALDQDAFGYHGVQVRADGDLSVWAKPLNESGARGVVLLNGTGTPADVTVSLTEIGLRAGSATVRDLWARADRGSFKDSYTATAIPSHGAAALKITGVEPARPSGAQVFLSDLPWIYGANGLGPVERDTSNGA